jgi:hypothetical protein
MTENEIVALISLCGVVLVAIINTISQNLSIKREVKHIRSKVDNIEEKNDKQYLGILRLTVMSPEMPVSERIIAGDEYIERGGNGDIKKYYQEFLKDHIK